MPAQMIHDGSLASAWGVGTVMFAGVDRVVPCEMLGGSDTFCQSTPGPGEYQSLWDCFDKPVEAAPNVAHQRVTSREDRQRRDGFQTAHWPQPLFQEAVVTLDSIGAIAAGPMQNARHNRAEGRWIATRLVSNDPPRRRSSRSNRPFEERAGRGHVTRR